MANINQIRLSGTTYQIEDSSANKTVSLTQAQYDALAVKDPNTYYVITDASGGDLSQYMTSAQTMSAITEATSGKADSSSVYTKSETSGATEISTALGNKQDTLVSGTNIKTINNQSLLGEGNITIEGGGGTVDPSLDVTSPNAVANSAITNAINTLTSDKFDAVGALGYTTYDELTFGANHVQKGSVFFNKVNGKSIVNIASHDRENLQLIETSAITISVTSASTDTQVPSAKAVYDALQEGGGGTVDPSLDITSPNAVANSAITTAINSKQDTLSAGTGIEISGDVISVDEGILEATANSLYELKEGVFNINKNLENNYSTTAAADARYATNASINTKLTNYYNKEYINDKMLAISAGLNDLNSNFGGLKIVKLTQLEYDAIVTKDSNTLYIITE